jgi:predicted nucleotidyltransferase
MKRQLQIFKEFIEEAKDPAYFQDTFNFTVLISMDKNRGGSRDETKNDIRALPEVLTVTLIEKEKGGVQKDLGNTYLSTLKIHVRRPRDTSKELMMKRVVKQIARLKGVSVLRYKERKPKQRRKAFYGPGSYTKRVQNVNELDYQKVRRQKAGEYAKDKSEYISTGPQKTGGAPFNRPASTKRGKSAPPIVGATGGAFGLEEAILDEAMKTAADLPEDIVVVVDKQNAPNYYKIYYALREDLRSPLKAGDLDRMERGVGVYGVLSIQLGRNFPYEGNYVVESVKAADGYGPLLYDVALETVGKAGLKPDTKSISDDASAVWKFYDTQRDDVQGELLVMDIDQYHTVMPRDRAAKPGENEHLAQVYRKKNRSTTKELQDLNKIVDIFTPPPAKRKSPYEKKDLSRFNRLREDILISVGKDDDLATFEMQPQLQQKIWDGDEKIHPGVKAALMDIVDEFIERLDLDAEIKDIIMTGSLANYNWSKFSDIDLHIIVDFKEVNDNEELVRRFFDAVRSNWNKTHDIKVKGHEVELYVQDENEPHVSTGVYSLMNDKWLVKPNKVKPFIDKKTAKKKAADIEREVDKVASILYDGNHEAALDKAAYLKEKIKTMRQAGLEKAGVFSPENLAFKMLRRSEALSKLHDVYIKAYDQALSLDQ